MAYSEGKFIKITDISSIRTSKIIQRICHKINDLVALDRKEIQNRSRLKKIILLSEIIPFLPTMDTIEKKGHRKFDLSTLRWLPEYDGKLGGMDDFSYGVRMETSLFKCYVDPISFLEEIGDERFSYLNKEEKEKESNYKHLIRYLIEYVMISFLQKKYNVHPIILPHTVAIREKAASLIQSMEKLLSNLYLTQAAYTTIDQYINESSQSEERRTPMTVAQKREAERRARAPSPTPLQGPQFFTADTRREASTFHTEYVGRLAHPRTTQDPDFNGDLPIESGAGPDKEAHECCDATGQKQQVSHFGKLAIACRCKCHDW